MVTPGVVGHVDPVCVVALRRTARRGIDSPTLLEMTDLALSGLRCPQVADSKADRFVVDPGGPQDVAVSEVNVTVTHERRGTVSVGWRYLPLAIAILAVGAALSVSSLGSSRRAAAAAPRSCVTDAGYGGLGARVSAFDPNNDNSTGPAGPTPGTAWYVVTAIARGCVTSFSVQDGGSPPLSARDLLSLVSHPYLPRDAKRIVNQETCAVWRSAALRRATGRSFASATAVAQVGGIPGRAEIRATSSPRC
jgi:hypothetical protein